MPVVTLTGKLASGAREVGEVVAGLLGVDIVDQQIMVQAARRCGVSVDEAAGHDERYGSFRERLAIMFRTFLERSAASGADPLTGATGLETLLSRSYAEMAVHEEPQVSGQLYLKAVTAIVRELAESGEIVILGRGSQMILEDMPAALHVLCVAPKALRVTRLAEREGICEEEALRRLTEGDRARCSFYKKFWKVEVENPNLYDLTIDTARLSYAIAADLVTSAARAKAAKLA